MNAEKKMLRHAFGKAAVRYDHVADIQRDVGARLMAASVIDDIPATVLDAGCGTGHGLQLIAIRWPQAKVIALDFAAPMLRRIPADDAMAICGDIEALPLASESIDLMWSSLALQWCDAAQVVREAQHVLRGGGYLVASTLGPGTFAELRRAFVGVDDFQHTNDFADVGALRRALVDGGLTPLTILRVELVRHYADLRSLLASVRDLGANHVAARNRRRGLMGKSAWRRFAANGERMRTSSGLPVTYDTYLLIARK